MILSVSRRTDIPAFYTDWFFNRLKEEYVLVRNPLNYHQVSKISLNPSVVDCLVFWTKDPTKILKRLDWLKEYKYYFQITINAYNKKIERYLPPKDEVIAAFQDLSDRIGKEKTIWRYDPIILTDQIELQDHSEHFGILASKLEGYTDRCIISFLDFYEKTERKMKSMKSIKADSRKMIEIGATLSQIARRHRLKIETCSEQIDLSEVGIEHAKCIDDRLISKITGKEMIIEKDKNQREKCGCVASVDIGAYNTCKHGCLYCYANASDVAVRNNLLKHNPESPMLIGNVEQGDKITDRKMQSCLSNQQVLRF